MSPFGSKLSATVVTSKFEAETRAVVNRNLFREYADDTLLAFVHQTAARGWMSSSKLSATVATSTAQAEMHFSRASPLIFTTTRQCSRIELIDQMHLEKIHRHAFENHQGTLVVKGKFPKLMGIAEDAFRFCDRKNSNVALDSLPRLQVIGHEAFYKFQGRLVVSGCFPMLKEIHESVVSLVNLSNLEMVDEGAFYHAEGAVEMVGTFGSLEHIGGRAFETFSPKTSSVKVDFCI